MGVQRLFGRDKNVDPNKVAVYIRWSTDEQGQGTTLEVQREACEYYCKSQGWSFREDLVYVDDGYSGGSLERPALTRLREAVRAGHVGCVVVYKLDRLSRSLLDCVTLVRHEWKDRCALYSTKENFDTESPVGQMVFNILVSFAEFERNIIRDRTLSGKRKRAAQGRNAGQRYPYGYRKGEDGSWALDGWDQERQCFTGPAAVVHRVFRDFLSGVGTTSIADALRKEGLPAPMGGEWRFGAVIRILDNPNYAGQYLYGMRTVKSQRKGGPRYAVDSAIPPIVSREDFDRVQQLRRERRGRAPRSLASEYLLSGLARCQQCGAPVNGSTGPNKRYYVCTNRVLLRSCDCAYIGAEKLEAAFLADVKDQVSGSNVHYPARRLRAEVEDRIEASSRAVQRAEAELTSVQRKQARLDNEFLTGNLDGKAYSRLAAAVEQELAWATERLEQARRGLQEAQATTVDLDRLAELSKRVDAWAHLTREEMKQLCREIAASLTVYQKKSPLKGGKKENPNPLHIAWLPRLDLLKTVQKPEGSLQEASAR